MAIKRISSGSSRSSLTVSAVDCGRARPSCEQWHDISPKKRKRQKHTDLEREQIRERLEKYVLRLGDDKCWHWLGSSLPTGYGKFTVTSGKRMKRVYAHRAAFELANGYLPKVVRHTCDKPSCCNPAHLLGGTHKQNSQDMIERGRANPPRGERAAKAKLTERDVKAILADPRPYKTIALAFGLDRSSISRIKRREVWSHVQGPRALTKKNKGLDNPRAVLDEEAVRRIREATGTQKEIAATFGVSQTTISKIKLSKHWACQSN